MKNGNANDKSRLLFVWFRFSGGTPAARSRDGGNTAARPRSGAATEVQLSLLIKVYCV